MRYWMAAGLLAGSMMFTSGAADARPGNDISIELRARVMASCAVISLEPVSQGNVSGIELQTVCNSEFFQISLRPSDDTVQFGQVISTDAQVSSSAAGGMISVRLLAPGVQRIFIETPDVNALTGQIAVDILTA